MRAALTLIAGGTIDPLPLVSHRLGLDGVGRALELQRRGESTKAVIIP
jgi:L-iditol 2-dehydrogenase